MIHPKTNLPSPEPMSQITPVQILAGQKGPPKSSASQKVPAKPGPITAPVILRPPQKVAAIPPAPMRSTRTVRARTQKKHPENGRALRSAMMDRPFRDEVAWVDRASSIGIKRVGEEGVCEQPVFRDSISKLQDAVCRSKQAL
jgi:hypothetical protein